MMLVGFYLPVGLEGWVLLRDARPINNASRFLPTRAVGEGELQKKHKKHTSIQKPTRGDRW